MIFGTDIPSIKNTPNGTLELPNSNVTYNYNNSNIQELIALNGDREFHLTNSANFLITVNLFKRNDPKADLLSILAFENNTVLFRPHKDENVIDTDFQVISIRPFYLETTNFFDKVSITLFSSQNTR